MVAAVKPGLAANGRVLQGASLPVFSSFARLHTLITMAETNDHPLEQVLQLCAAAAPAPWYPSIYAKEAAIQRDSLDPHLERLRLAGLIRLTDWVKGTGQGYVLTPAGSELLANPRALGLLRTGNLRLEKPAAPPPLLDDDTTKAFARGDAVRDVFMVQTPARVTYALIFANLLVFFYGMQLANHTGIPINEYLGTDNLMGGQKQNPKLDAVYLSEGAMQSEDLVRGQWWRLISNFFVHLGVIHVAGNMFMLYMIGPVTERMWGSVRYFVLYMLAGLGGSCAMAGFSPVPFLGAGASGAIWGLMTSVITWLILNREHMPRPFVNTMLRRLFNLVLLNVFLSFAPGISMSAHFGGGAAGVVVSLLLHTNRHGKVLVKMLTTVGLVLVPVLCLAGVVVAQRTDSSWEGLEYNFRRLPQMEAAEKSASAIIDAKLQPILLRQAQGLSEQDLREAVLAQHETVLAFEKGLEAARKPPAYTDSRVENARQKGVQYFERKISDVERKTWQLLLSPAVRDELRISGRLIRQKVQPLLMLPAAARQKESLEEAQAALQEGFGKLFGLRELLETMGPMQSDPGLEENRKETIEELTLSYDLLKAASIGLTEGSNWPEAKQKEYDQLLERINKRGA